MYLAYSRTVEGGVELRLARFTFNGDALEPESERILLRILADGDCCHAAGSLAFGPDGDYAVPPGNLFSLGGGRAEVYAMGMRNPFRFSLDSRTGWLYFGDVGPDAEISSATRGPRGYDEINRARTAGNYGRPYCIADNQPYIDYDFATGLSGAH